MSLSVSTVDWIDTEFATDARNIAITLHIGVVDLFTTVQCCRRVKGSVAARECGVDGLGVSHVPNREIVDLDPPGFEHSLDLAGIPNQ
jgi:hypothetical protein